MLVTALSPVIGYDKASTLPALQDLAPVCHSLLAVASDVTHIMAIRGTGPAARPS
jgi:fumarate hydratase class II